MRRALAFLRRDLRIAASYRMSFVLTAVGGLVTLATFFFLARTVGDSKLLQNAYGADYFSFALVGVAVASALRSLQTSFAQRLREAQTDGSLEVLLSAPLSTFRVVALMALYPVASAIFRSVTLLLLGAWLFGAKLEVDVVSLALTLALAILAFAPLGLLSAAFVLSFKRGDPFSYLLDVATYLLSGVIYPVEVLPPLLQWAAQLLPATWALEGLRGAVLRGQSAADLGQVFLVLALFSVALWPLAALGLSLSRRYAERAGTLAQF